MGLGLSDNPAVYISSDVPPPFLQLPFAGCRALLGIDETIIRPEDMTSYQAYWNLWIQFRDKKEKWLEQTDFKNVADYHKYFMLSLGLLHYPKTIIGGREGTGKSLIRSVLTFYGMKLFGKNAIMDTPPPEPELYPGKIHCLYEQEIANLIVDELRRLNQFEKEIAGCADREQRIIMRQQLKERISKMVLFRAEASYDESQMWGACERRTNLTVLNDRISRIRRHLFMGMYFCYQNPLRADKMIYDGHTHEIICFLDAFPNVFPRGTCSYEITDVRPGGSGVTKWMHLDPNKWKGYWDPFNMPTVVHDIDIYLGGKKRTMKKSDWDNIGLSEPGGN